QSPAAVRQVTFGRFAALEPEQYAKIGSDQVGTAVPRLAVDPHRLARGLGRSADDHVKVTEAAHVKAAPPKAAAANKHVKVGFFMKSLHCVVTTTDSGDCDEIRVGGTAVSAEGKVKKIGPFPKITIDDGQTFHYNPDKLWAEFEVA